LHIRFGFAPEPDGKLLMPLRFMAALLGLALLALPFTLPARAETTDQLLGETFYDCYASIDANYFTNRDMKRGAMLYQAIEAMWARGADRLRKDPATVERQDAIRTRLPAKDQEKLLKQCMAAASRGNFAFRHPYAAQLETPRFRELLARQQASLREDDKLRLAVAKARQELAEEEARKARAAASEYRSTADDGPDPAALALARDCDNSAAQTIRSADRDFQEASRMVKIWIATRGVGVNYGWEPLRRGCSTLQSGYRTLGNKQCPARFQNMVQSFYDRYYINLPTGSSMTCEG